MGEEIHHKPVREHWSKGVKPEPDEEFQVVMTVFVNGLGKPRHAADVVKEVKRALRVAFGEDNVRVDLMQTLRGEEMVGDMGWVKRE